MDQVIIVVFRREHDARELVHRFGGRAEDDRASLARPFSRVRVTLPFIDDAQYTEVRNAAKALEVSAQVRIIVA